MIYRPVREHSQAGRFRFTSPICSNNKGDSHDRIDPRRRGDGEPRVMGSRVDMGADEVGEKQADFTRDGRIDISDLSVLSGSWDAEEGQERWYVLCDLWEDDVIDIGDLAAFADDWMWEADWADTY